MIYVNKQTKNLLHSDLMILAKLLNFLQMRFQQFSFLVEQRSLFTCFFTLDFLLLITSLKTKGGSSPNKFR